MVGGVNQRNIERVIEFARGGFGCVEIFFWRTTPGYEPDPGQFPDGLRGLKGVDVALVFTGCSSCWAQRDLAALPEFWPDWACCA